MRTRFLFVVLALGACSGPSGTISLTTGGESDTFTRSPAPTSLLVEAVQRDGTRTTLADAGLPATGAIDLGSPSSSAVVSIQVNARDSTGTTRVSGASPFVELLALDGITLPVFVQRDGEWARMPGSLPDSRSAPLLTATPRGVYGVGGLLGDAAAPPVFGYDLAFLDQFSTECAVTRAPRSMVLQNASLLLVDDSGASVVDLSACASVDLGPLADGGVPTWASVSGGATVIGEDGSAYIVGQTKPDIASGTIVKVDTSGVVTAQTDSVQRKGAAAAWATGRGLFLFGGTDTAGVEMISNGVSASVGDYAPDATAGMLATQLDANTMLVVGSSVIEMLDLGCASGCAPKPFSQPGDAGPLTGLTTLTGLFKVATGVFILVGDDAQSTTHVLRIDASSVAEVPLKIARTGARAVQTQTGAVLILGGGSLIVESYVP